MFEDLCFDVIIIDSSTFVFVGEFYFVEFYVDFKCILCFKGKLYYYIGDLKSVLGFGVVVGVVCCLK